MIAVGLAGCATTPRAEPPGTSPPPSTETFASTPDSTTTTTQPSPCIGLGIPTDGSPASLAIEPLLLTATDVPSGWTTTGPTIAAAPGPPSTAVFPSTSRYPVASITYGYPPPGPPTSGPAPVQNSVSETLARLPSVPSATGVLDRLNAQASQCDPGTAVALPGTSPALSARLNAIGSSYQIAAYATVYVQRGPFVAELTWSDVHILLLLGGGSGAPPLPTPAQMSADVAAALAPLPSS